MGIKTKIIEYFIANNELELVNNLDEYIITKEFQERGFTFKKDLRIMVALDFYYKSMDEDKFHVDVYFYNLENDNKVTMWRGYIKKDIFHIFFKNYRKIKIENLLKNGEVD